MSVTLKGTKDGLLITLGAGEWPEIMADLRSQLDRPRAAQFFRGAHARLSTGERMLSEIELEELSKLLARHSMELELAPPPEPRPRPPAPPEDEDRESEIAVDRSEHEIWTEAAMVRRTVRSGQVIRFPGHVVVFGDVNPGAEIVAGGDVIIWGRLRGVVHAGASGDDQAVVGALFLAPTQLRIGTHIARAPDDRGKQARGPELARVRDGRIVIEGWKAGKD